MIQDETFALWMGVLADRIGRELKPATLAAYNAIMSRELTTEEFVAAAQAVLRTAQYNVWPSPGEFVTAVRPDGPALSAHAAFEQTYALVATPRAYGRAWDALLAEVADRVGAPAARAADALRGVWARHDESELPYIRRDFVREYEAAASVEAQASRLEHVLPGRGVQLLAAAGFPRVAAGALGALLPAIAPPRRALPASTSEAR